MPGVRLGEMNSMDKAILFITGIVTLLLGLAHVLFYRKLARKYAAKPRRATGFLSRYRQNRYSESSYRVLSVLFGIAATSTGLLLGMVWLFGELGHEYSPFKSLLALVLLIIMVGFVFAGIIASYMAFLRD